MPNEGEHREDVNVSKKTIFLLGKRIVMVLGDAGAKPGQKCSTRNVLNFSTKAFLMAQTNKCILLENPSVFLNKLKLFLTFVSYDKRSLNLYIFSLIKFLKYEM